MQTNYPELEKQCDYCHGEGVVDGGLCVVCRGNRTVFTEFGERLVDLIDRHVGIALRRLDCVRD